MEHMDAGKEAPPLQAPATPRPHLRSDGVIAQLTTLLRAVGSSPRRGRLGLFAIGAVAVICANAAAQVRLNSWQGAFYEAIEQRHMAAFMTQLMVFAVIAGGLLVLVVSQTWLQAMINVRLREWLTHDLLDQWLVRKRVYMLSFAGQIGVNPDQRIQQDAQHLTELTTILAIGLVQSSLLLTSFTGVLWVLSGQVVFDLGNGPMAIPGYMVWCALAYSLGGSLLAWHVGRPLIPLNAERYAREADLRVALVRVNEHADGIVLHDGEADERRLLDEPVNGVVTMMTRLAGGLARLTWITSGYGWLALVVPIVVAAPGYFGGHMSFGTLMMVVGAFNTVQASLRWFVDNLPQIADWRATLLRVVAFRDALAAVDTIGADTGRIEVVEFGVRQARARRSAAGAARSLRDARPEPGQDAPGRARPDPRKAASARHAVQGTRGDVALGRGDASAAAARGDDVHAATALLRSARCAPPCAIPPSPGTSTRRRGGRARAGGPRPPRALARPDRALGGAPAVRRAAAPRPCPPPAARAALGGRRRRDQRA